MYRSPLVSNVFTARGSLDVYVATALVLPLLLLTLFGGMAALHLAEVSTDVAFAAQVGAETAALAGGVTPLVSQSVAQSLADAGLVVQPLVSGPAPSVPWGQPMTITVQVSVPLQGFPFTLVGLAGATVQFGEQEVVDSEAVAPAAP
ncbi:MAG: hypothetical protein ACYCVA_02635 [Sulfobacillus sp.]